MTGEPGTGLPDRLSFDERFYAALLEDDPVDLYEAAPCGYLSALPDGTIVKVNGTFLRWTGHQRDWVLGRRLQDLLGPGERIFYETHLAPALRMQGRVREIAAEIMDARGGRIPALINAVLTRDAAGNEVMIRAAIMDATERREYERELLAARRRAEQSEARASTLARTLQQTLLPPTVLPVPGLDIAGAYRPAGDGAEVGGDFYDVFATGRGTWAVMLGDVRGKGAQAAVLTALARYTLRAQALDTPKPSGVLAGLHRAFLHYQPDEFCTAIFAVIERNRDGIVLTSASGGHPLPLHVDAAGRLSTVGRPGTVLGMIPIAKHHDETVLLAAGDTVLLYTDGVTEAGRASGRRGRADRTYGEKYFGEQRLAEVLVSATGAGPVDAQGVADRVVAAAVDFQDGWPRDDIAVVVVRVP